MFEIELKGTSEKIGEQRGNLLKPVITIFMEYLMKNSNFGFSECIDWALNWKNKIYESFPELAKEIKSSAKISGIEENLLFAYNFRAWNALCKHPSHPDCYNIGFSDKNTGPLHGGILEDGISYIIEKITPQDGFEHISISLPGTVWCVRGMNERGLTCGQVSAFPGLYTGESDFIFGTQDYARSYFILRHIMQYCENVEEAIRIFKKFSGMGTFMFADKNDKIAVVEKAGELTGVRFCENDYIISGGHYLCKDLLLKLSGKNIYHIPAEGHIKRHYAIFRLVKENATSLKLMKKILTSCKEEEGQFCNDITQCATIGIPKSGQFLVAGHVPCRSEFKSFVFK
ncbi:MAG: C45 family peptidase [Candidatus Omnitrophica bacterium]|nr:C45 family peptidase [Candidatus Omnitrophota bacterium]